MPWHHRRTTWQLLLNVLATMALDPNRLLECEEMGHECHAGHTLIPSSLRIQWLFEVDIPSSWFMVFPVHWLRENCGAVHVQITRMT